MRQRETEQEERAIRITISVNLLMGILGLAFALYLHSDAILLDGVFSVIHFAISLLSLFVARLIRRPGDDRFPFGYAVFEPMLNLAKGLMIAIVLLFALIAAVEALMTGGRAVSPSGGLFYAIIATLGCAIAALFTRRTALQVRSPIVEVDAKNWVIDALLSATVAIAFGVAVVLKRSQFAWMVPFVDPIIVIVLVTLSVALPIQIIGYNWRQIIGMAPGAPLPATIHALAAEALAAIPFKKFHLRTARLGRLVYFQLYLIISPTETGSFDVFAQDRLRERLYEKARDKFPNVAMDVIVTSDSVWHQRSIITV